MSRKSEFDEQPSVARLQDVALIALGLSLLMFFVAVVLLGTGSANLLVVENIAAYASLGIALSSMTYIVLGLTAAR